MSEEIKGIFIHHVYFWLAEPRNAEHKKSLIEGLKKLSKVSKPFNGFILANQPILRGT